MIKNEGSGLVEAFFKKKESDWKNFFIKEKSPEQDSLERNVELSDNMLKEAIDECNWLLLNIN